MATDKTTAMEKGRKMDGVNNMVMFSFMRDEVVTV